MVADGDQCVGENRRRQFTRELKSPRWKNDVMSSARLVRVAENRFEPRVPYLGTRICGGCYGVPNTGYRRDPGSFWDLEHIQTTAFLRVCESRRYIAFAFIITFLCLLCIAAAVILAS